MTLPFDTARCMGAECDRRDNCERYLQREHAGPETPFYEHYCGTTDGIIEVQEDDHSQKKSI